MRVLVTGSRGFVGQHLCRYLLSIGDDVIAWPGPDGPDALDVTDKDAVVRRIGDAQPNGIIHLAGVSSVAWSHANPVRTLLVNALGTVNVLQAVRQVARDARLLLIGSGEMYGLVPVGHLAREEDVLRPLSPYAASKVAAEIMARQYTDSYGVQVICARPFNHLGRGQAAHFVVPSLARQIADNKRGQHEAVIKVGDLSSVRDFLHVEDVIRGYRLLLDRGDVGTAYNLCSEEPLSIRELLNQLMEVAGVRLQVRVDPERIRPIEIPWLVGNASRVKSLGWHPERTVREALAEALSEALSQ